MWKHQCQHPPVGSDLCEWFSETAALFQPGLLAFIGRPHVQRHKYFYENEDTATTRLRVCLIRTSLCRCCALNIKYSPLSAAAASHHHGWENL